jgi:hypothetical protein
MKQLEFVFSITQQIIKCPTYIERSKPIPYNLHNSMFFFNFIQKY